MRRISLTVAACLVVTGSHFVNAQPFETPLYINLGGPEVVDSFGRTWLGDQGAGADPLNIRPDNAGGPNVIEDWCNPSAESIAALVAETSLGATFNPSHPGDTDLFRSIRWDDGAAPPDYILDIPVPSGSYDVTLYFCEQCCPQRHEKVLIQGDVAFEDVSVDSYSGGATHTPGLFTQEDVVVGDDGNLNITLLGCLDPECPGGGDGNPTLTALAVVPSDYDPCADESFISCPTGLSCSVDADGNVTGSWSAPACGVAGSYEVYRNGELVETLPGDATGFSVTTSSRLTDITVKAVSAEDAPTCVDQTCSVLHEGAPFDVPLYVNLGGPEVVDSFGRTWLGDQGAGADALRVRPDDAGGANVIEAWCSPSPESIASLIAETSLGVTFDPSHPGDTDAMRSIRWDEGNAAPDYVLEVPVPPGSYTISLYFCEQCCPARHERVLIQGDVAFEDVSVDSYSGGATHTPGLFTQEDVVVGDDGILNITLLQCLDPDCPGGTDPNPTLTALAVVPSDYDPCADESFISCPSGLSCSVDADGNVTGSWSAPACGAAEGYEIYRDGELIETLAGDATSFSSTAPTRLTDFTVRTVGAEGLCVDQSCMIFREDAPFALPVRINMGGAETVDSMGRTWLGDGPGAGDPLGIRPNDVGGKESAENWSSGAFKPESFDKFGLDPTHPGDAYIFNTIRWDNAADGPDNNFLMEIPVPVGEYQVNMYFTEGCCPGRNFKIELQGVIVDDNVSYLDYTDVDPPELGHTGLLSFEGIGVASGILNIGLLPCPECPRPEGVNPDNNAIIQALEILRTGDLPTVNQIAGDCNQDGAQNVSDIICCVGQLFPEFPLLNRHPESPCATAAGTAALLDINGDGRFNTADVVSYADFLFGGGSGPPAECGPLVDLGCGDNASCQ